MQYLIDTHVLIWYLNGDKALPEKYARLMFDPKNKLYVSMVSIWEITIKMNLNKLNCNKSIEEIESFILSRDYEILNISFDHLKTLYNIERHHADPFDRLLIAQAISEEMSIISADRHFSQYPVNVIW